MLYPSIPEARLQAILHLRLPREIRDIFEIKCSLLPQTAFVVDNDLPEEPAQCLLELLSKRLSTARCLAYPDLPLVEVWHSSISVTDTYEKKALSECQSPVVNARSANTECVT